MRHLSISELRIGLQDLLEKRIDALLKTKIGRAYEPMVRAFSDELEKLEVVLNRRPLADELKTASQLHDNTVRALHHLILGLSFCQANEDQKTTLLRALELLPTLKDIRDKGYAEAADVARQHKELIEEIEDQLKEITVLNGTLKDCFDQYIAAGEEIHRLLQRRATLLGALPERERNLRSRIIGVLGRMRSSIRDEIAYNSDLSPQLEEQIFAYFDQLENMH